MKQYKYTLDKSSRKFICPRCDKKTFVKYLETENNIYLSGEFGRCDRESNCGYYQKPETEFKNTYEIVNAPKLEPSFHSLELVEETFLGEYQNNFVEFLKILFRPDEVREAIQKYLIGTWNSWKGTTVFWQIDQLERVHHGKVMVYNIETGKRAKNKEGKGIFSTVRSLLKLEDFVLNQCLFGLHLIKENTKLIALVEAEKTAVIMSVFKPEYVWLATGSKGGFKYEFMKAIKQYKIVAFPDKSEFNDWLNIAIELNGFGFKISVSDWLENIDYPNGTDLADVYINELKVEPRLIDWKPMQEHEFSNASLEVYKILQERKNKNPGSELTKQEFKNFIQTEWMNYVDNYFNIHQQN
jgi:hypothetical protein